MRRCGRAAGTGPGGGCGVSATIPTPSSRSRIGPGADRRRRRPASHRGAHPALGVPLAVRALRDRPPRRRAAGRRGRRARLRDGVAADQLPRASWSVGSSWFRAGRHGSASATRCCSATCSGRRQPLPARPGWPGAAGEPAGDSSSPARRSGAGYAGTCMTGWVRRWPRFGSGSRRLATWPPTIPSGPTSCSARPSEHVAAIVADVRRLVHGLRPPALDEFGLAGAVDQLARRLSGADGGARISVLADHDLAFRGGRGGGVPDRFGALANVVRPCAGIAVHRPL